MQDSVSRFTLRVADYVAFRPSYPAAVLALLRRECGLCPGMTVADIGSGTGIFSRLLLEAGAEVYAVEPNAAMRAAAEKALGEDPRFHSVSAPAERTTLAAGSVSLVAAAQAFHWFDAPAARREFCRILRPGGWAVLLWNHRLESGTPFLAAYEELIRTYAPAYPEIARRYPDSERMEDFFAPAQMRQARFANAQTFDFEGFYGRVLSSSYVPRPGDAGYEPLAAALRRLFASHQQGGRVRFDYECRMYYGQLG
jgi:SAM-dependent methyltransferase